MRYALAMVVAALLGMPVSASTQDILITDNPNEILQYPALKGWEEASYEATDYGFYFERWPSGSNWDHWTKIVGIGLFYSIPIEVMAQDMIDENRTGCAQSEFRYLKKQAMDIRLELKCVHVSGSSEISLARLISGTNDAYLVQVFQYGNWTETDRRWAQDFIEGVKLENTDN